MTNVSSVLEQLSTEVKTQLKQNSSDILEKLKTGKFEDTFKDYCYCFKKAMELIIRKDGNLHSLYSYKEKGTFSNKYRDFLNNPAFNSQNEEYCNIGFSIIKTVATLLNDYCGKYDIPMDTVLSSIISYDGIKIGFYGTKLRSIFSYIARNQYNIRQTNEVYKYRVQNLDTILENQGEYNKDECASRYFELPSVHISGLPKEWEVIRIPKWINGGLPITGIYGNVAYSDGVVQNIIPVIYNYDVKYGNLAQFLNKAVFDKEKNTFVHRNTKGAAVKGQPLYDNHILPMAKYPITMLETRFGNKAVRKMCDASGVMLLIENDDHVENTREELRSQSFQEKHADLIAEKMTPMGD